MAFFLLLLLPMSYGFVPLLRAATAMATLNTKMTNTKTTTKISSCTRSDDERKDAKEMANNAIARAWADVEHCRAAIKELEQELKELDHELEERQ